MGFTGGMSPSDFAKEDLVAWQLAMEAQRDAERAAENARQAGDVRAFVTALNRVNRLRADADSLLAFAVARKRSMS